MRFTTAGQTTDLHAALVHRRLAGRSPEAIRTHWAEVDGVRWPAKQVLALATGILRTSFISHTAMRVLRRLGFTTSPLPKELALKATADVFRPGQ